MNQGRGAKGDGSLGRGTLRLWSLGIWEPSTESPFKVSQREGRRDSMEPQ